MAKRKQDNDLPYNAQAERAVLGSAILSRECLFNVMSSLNEDDFFEGRHQLIYRAITLLFEQQCAVDILTVTEQLMNLKVLQDIGDVAYLRQCCDEMVALSSIDFYINIVNDQAVLRRVIQTARNINEQYLSDEIEEVDDFVLNAQKNMEKALSRRRVASFKSTEQIAPMVELEINNTPNAGEEGGVTGITTGFKRLNDLTLGLQKGDMVIIAARPSVGKTALALNIAYRAATRANATVGIFSLEMPSNLLLKRLIGAESCVSLTKISSGQLNDPEKVKVAKAVKTISNANIFIDDTPSMKMMDIIANSRKLQANHPDLGLIVIDYLGLITSTSNSKNPDSRQEEVRKMSLQIKSLARELKVPIILLSQLSRNVEQRGDNKRPMLSDLRDSGSIEQDADVVMLMYREDYYRNQQGQVTSSSGNKKMKDLTNNEKTEMSKEARERELIQSLPGEASYVEVNVAKNRNGRTGKVGLFFYKSFCKFDEPSEEWEAQMREIQDGND